MCAQSRVVVVGSYNQDLTWRCAEFPRPGETIVGAFTTGPGGKGSNQAVAAARAGAATTFIGALGDDAFGRSAEKFLRAEGVTTRIAWQKKLPTGNAAILVDAHAQNQIVIALGANAALAKRDLPAAAFRGARVVACQHEIALATNAHAFRLARRAGALTLLNPAPMRADFDPAILPLTDVLVPNESEFIALAERAGAAVGLTEAALATLGDADLQVLCRAFRVPTVIVTLGVRGCFVSQASGGTHLAAHAVTAVDTTGAGDAFVGGFAAGLVRFDGDVLAAARHGNATAALSVTQPGTAPSMPRAPEIARFMRAQKLRNRTA